MGVPRAGSHQCPKMSLEIFKYHLLYMKYIGTSYVVRLGLMDFRNFFIPYVFEVKESIFGSFSKLPCPSHLEKPGQLPVLQVLEGSVDWVLWISVISSFPTFSRSMNLFFAV